MQVETFFSHHGIQQNPFAAEEARDDEVFERMLETSPAHPDFTKVLGRIDKPTSSVVFGEKGSGKTAIRMLIERHVEKHNEKDGDTKTLLVAHDDLDTLVDRVVGGAADRNGADQERVDKLLDKIRLEDHQDAILSLGTTRLVDAILGTGLPSDQKLLSDAARRSTRKLPRIARVNIAVLAALYDQPRSGTQSWRWSKLCSRLRLGGPPATTLMRVLAIVLSLLAALFLIAGFVSRNTPAPTAETVGISVQIGLIPVGCIIAAAAMGLWVFWALRQMGLLRLARRISRQMPAVGRSPAELRTMLCQLRRGDLAGQPWPLPGVDSRNSRYELTSRFVQVLRSMGFGGLMILVDRVDEPTLISGTPHRMQRLIWPMLDNKFLQQDGVGLKLLLPVDLRHMLLRESPQFFQEARLDKQNLIDRLMWSGSVLYDLCSARLAACRESGGVEGKFMDLFAEDVSKDLIVDALDAMQQPRDAFKFIYATIQEHCRLVSDEEPVFKVPRITIETVRRLQSQRVQDFQRGLGPG